MKRFCMICGKEGHTLIDCPDGRLKADLSIGEWVYVYLLRRFKGVSDAAAHYRVSPSAMSMALRGYRSLPPQLMKDAGVSVDVKVNGVQI